MKLFRFDNTNDNRLRKARLNLLSRARKRHGSITPCGSWDRSFTLEDNTLFFWYTTPQDQSTHLVSEALDLFE